MGVVTKHYQNVNTPSTLIPSQMLALQLYNRQQPGNLATGLKLWFAIAQ